MGLKNENIFLARLVRYFTHTLDFPFGYAPAVTGDSSF
jgi:hypothetical protein